jgi:hypothetical protein
MATTQYRVQLTGEERTMLTQLLRKPSVPVFTHRRARILLAADHRPDRRVPTDAGIAAAVGVSPRTVARVRARWAAVGVSATLVPRPRQTRGRTRFAAATQARLVQLALGPAPPGHAHWSLRLLAQHAVVLELVEAISPESVRQILQKRGSPRA